MKSKGDLHKGQVGDSKRREQELQMMWPVAQQGTWLLLFSSLGNSLQTEHLTTDMSGGGGQEQEGVLPGGGLAEGRLDVWDLVLTMVLVARILSEVK